LHAGSLAKPQPLDLRKFLKAATFYDEEMSIFIKVIIFI
jgi:hypothetical protein